MRRILLISAMLLAVSPAMAAVTVTAVDEGSCVVRIDYVDTGAAGTTKVRAFALDITVDGGATIDSIDGFLKGDENGYGIFPGNFRDYINAADPNWDDLSYTPVAPSGDPGALGGLGTGGITIEMGSLYETTAPASSGTLCRLNITGTGTLNVTLAVNAIRGGIVQENSSPATVTALNGVAIICGTPPTCMLDVSGWEGDGIPDGYVGPEDLTTLMNVITQPDCVANGYYCDNTTLPLWQQALDVSGWEGSGIPDGYVGPEDLTSLMNVITSEGCVANGYYCTCPVPPPPY